MEENHFFSPPPYSEVIFFPQFLFLLKNFCAREARKIFWGGEGRLGKIGKKNEKLWFWNKIREKKWKIITEFQKSCYWKQKKGKKMKDLAASRPWFFIFFPLFQILHFFPPPGGGLNFKIYTPGLTVKIVIQLTCLFKLVTVLVYKLYKCLWWKYMVKIENRTLVVYLIYS